MKTKVKRLSKRAMAVVLVAIMVVSCLFVGVITTAGVDTTAFVAGTYVYLDPGSNWDNDNAIFAAYFFNSDTDNAFSTLVAHVNGGSTAKITVPGGSGKTWAKIIFVRYNPSGLTVGNTATWANKWNQTDDLSYDKNYNKQM